MNTQDFDNEGSNESAFDPARTGNAGEAIAEAFAKAQRWIERITLISVDVCFWLGLWAWFKFDNRDDTKSLIFYGTVLLVAALITVLVRMWYWIFSNKLGILKELKMLRLDLMARGSETRHTTASGTGTVTAPIRVRSSITWTEHVLWFLLSTGVIVVIAFSAGSFSSPDTVMRTYTQLQEHGAVTSSELTSHNMGPSPVTSIPDSCSVPTTGPLATWVDPASPAAREPAVVTMGFRDEHGTPLPYIIDAKAQAPGAPCKYQYLFRISMPKPIWPGEKWTLRSEGKMKEDPVFLFREGDVWNYRIGCQYGGGLSEYHTFVTLPKGAEIVSVEPKPRRECQTYDGADGSTRTVLEFKERRRDGGNFSGLIKYRLPQSAEAAK